VNPWWAQTTIVLSVAVGFGVAAWRLGWSIWEALEEKDRVPEPLTLEKSIYFAVGIAMILAIVFLATWALRGGLLTLITLFVLSVAGLGWALYWFLWKRPSLLKLAARVRLDRHGKAVDDGKDVWEFYVSNGGFHQAANVVFQWSKERSTVIERGLADLEPEAEQRVVIGLEELRGAGLQLVLRWQDGRGSHQTRPLDLLPPSLVRQEGVV